MKAFMPKPLLPLAFQLMRQRLTIYGLCLVGEILAVLAMMIPAVHRHTVAADAIAGYGIILVLGLFIVFAVLNEKIWTANRYRLLPLSGGQLTAAVLLANLLVTLVIAVSQLALLFIGNLIDASLQARSSNPTVDGGGAAMLGFLLLVIAVLYGWALISFASLLTRTIKAQLPIIKQLVVNGIASLAIFAVALLSVKWLLDGFGFMFQPQFSTVYTFTLSRNNHLAMGGLVYDIGLFLVMLVVLSAINSKLLNRFVDTVQPD